MVAMLRSFRDLLDGVFFGIFKAKINDLQGKVRVSIFVYNITCSSNESRTNE